MKNNYLMINEVQDRYCMTKEELLRFLRDNNEKFASTGKVFSTQIFPPSLIEALDKVLDYHGSDEEENQSEKMADDEKEKYLARIHELEDKLKKSDELIAVVKQEKEDLKQLQTDILTEQDQRSSANGKIISKLQTRIDTLSGQLENLKKLKDEQLNIKDKRIAELENTVQSIHKQLDDNANLEKEKLNAELQLVNIRKVESQLNKDLARKDDDIKKLEEKLINYQDEKNNMDNEMLSYRGEIETAVKSLTDVIAGLRYVMEQDSSTITTLADLSGKAEPMIIENEKPDTEETDSTEVFTQSILQESNNDPKDEDDFPPS